MQHSIQFTFLSFPKHFPKGEGVSNTLRNLDPLEYAG